MVETNFIKKEILIDGNFGKPITLDVNFMEKSNNQSIIIFCHGFKGFKDWGTFNKMAEVFARHHFFFVKFNFSHNGTSPADLSDIHDLEAFGNNNFEIELDDLGCVLSWLENSKNPFKTTFNVNDINLIGHSRGGGIAMLKAIEDIRIKKVAAWASVNDFEKYMTLSDVNEWKKSGVSYVENSRTKIKLPLYYQFYENYYQNEGRLNLKFNLLELSKPLLLMHGTQDETVPIADAEWVYEQLDHSILVKIENGNHSFGACHPWDEESLPENLSFAMEETIEFFTF